MGIWTKNGQKSEYFESRKKNWNHESSAFPVNRYTLFKNSIQSEDCVLSVRKAFTAQKWIKMGKLGLLGVHLFHAECIFS